MNKLLLMLGLTLMIGCLVTGCGSASLFSEQAPEQVLLKTPQVGKPAPDFSLTNLDKETVSLSDFRGNNPVLINFWATWCRPCVFEMPFLEQVHKERSDRDLVILAVDIGENRATVENFLQEQGLSLIVLMDEDKAVTARYNIRYVPTTFLVDKNGIIQTMKIGAFTGVDEIEQILAEIMP